MRDGQIKSKHRVVDVPPSACPALRVFLITQGKKHSFPVLYEKNRQTSGMQRICMINPCLFRNVQCAFFCVDVYKLDSLWPVRPKRRPRHYQNSRYSPGPHPYLPDEPIPASETVGAGQDCERIIAI
jgi:hypothetical protein